MRFWYKKILDKNFSGKDSVYKYTSFKDYEKELGGYKPNRYFLDQKSFFKRYLNDHRKHWDDFINKNISNKEKILSVGTGLGINELLLIKKKYNIVCSDLEIPRTYKICKELFGNFEYRKLNILSSYSEEKFDCIISLSLAFIFSNKEMEIFFENVFKSLSVNGKFVLDIGGSEDNFLSRIYDEFLLPLESGSIYLVYKLLGKKYRLFKRHEGYKYKNKEIIEIAKKKGFKIVKFQIDDFITDFERSKIISFIIRLLPFTKKILYILGHKMAYVRIFKFEK